MNTVILDKKIIELAKLEKQINILSALKENLRKEVFKMAESIVEPYRTDLATVSYAERKDIKILDEETLLKHLAAHKMVKYYQVIPRHFELNKAFQEEVKKGNFKHPLIKVETVPYLTIRFKEEKK